MHLLQWHRKVCSRGSAASARLRPRGSSAALVWPDFFDHTALDAERFTRRLDPYSRGNAELDRGEVIEFWAKIMEDHSEFIAPLLDPQEKMLIAASR